MTAEITLFTLISDWIEHLHIQRGQSPRGVAQYEKVTKAFFTWLKKNNHPQDPGLIERHHIEAWQKSLFYDAANVRNSTRASKLSAVKSFFRWLEYAGYRNDDPAKDIPSPRVVPALPHKFSTDELRYLFAAPDITKAAGVRDLAILKTLYASGPRITELANLNISDVLDNGGHIRLRIIGGKGGKSRTVTMRTNPSRALRAWLLLRKDISTNTDALFIRLKKSGYQGADDRLSVRGLQDVIKKYGRLVGIEDAEVFAHKMRATFATDLYDSGDDKCPRCGCGIRTVNIYELMALLGHEDPKTTMQYIAISERTLRKTAIPDKRFNEIEGEG